MTDLPRLLVLTDRTLADRPLADVVRAAVDGGCRAVVLREKDLPTSERLALVDHLAPVLRDAGGVLLSAGEELDGCDGVHLPRPAVTRAGGAVRTHHRHGVVGQSCHDGDEVAAAAATGVDYVTVSPVFPSRSKPGYGPVLGPEGLAQLAAHTQVAVYALGGVEAPEDVRVCLDAGAHGVAVMGAVMRADAPGRVVASLVSQTEQPA